MDCSDQQADEGKTQSHLQYWLGSFYHIDDNGWISISLRWTTFIWCMALLFSLLFMLWQTCDQQQDHQEFDCYGTSATKSFPMVSAVVTEHLRGRFFVFLGTGVMYHPIQQNMRVVYMTFKGIISDRKNKMLMFFCIMQIITLPLLAIFDTHHHRTIHRPIVVFFFLNMGFYTTMVASVICQHPELFPGQSMKIKVLKFNKDLFFSENWLLGFTFAYWKHHGPVPYIEWVVISHMFIFYAVVQSVFTHYDTVHTPLEKQSSMKVKRQ